MSDIAAKTIFSWFTPPRAAQTISAKFLLSEATGSLGDLGTFVPIMVAMVQIVGFEAGSILFCTGLACIAAGLVFRAPMSVQPMKAIGALAIGGSLTAGQASTAGLTVALCMLIMSMTGLIRWLSSVLAQPVLRGLQMAVALQLLIKGMHLALFVPASQTLRPFWAVDGLALAAIGALLILLLRRRLALAALGLIVIGFVATYLKEPGLIGSTGFALWRPSWPIFEASALSGAWLGGLAQIPLTLLNSVFAISMLAGQLFPNNRYRTTPTKIAVSVGLMNIPVCLLGGVPLCHGSGGLAAQYRFGARSSLAIIFRGAVLLTIGLFFGKVALVWMLAFPSSLLGVFLLVAGLGLAAASRCWQTRLGLLITCIIAIVHLTTGILALGFALGWLAYTAIVKAGPNVLPRFTKVETTDAR
ncbi:MAG: sulfate transporter [Actinobacteria bacterium]|nr:sulfate transporter [Actinomycetota bacterium]